MRFRRALACVGVGLLVVLVLCISGCQGESARTTPTTEAAWSIASPWGGPEQEAPSLFPVVKDGGWGFIDTTGRVIVDYQFEEAGQFSEGLARVRVDGVWGYIDTSGAVALEPRFPWAASFHCGLAQVRTTDQESPREIGYVDKSGKMVIELGPELWDAYQFSEGLAGVRFIDDDWNESSGYIDTSGELVIWLPGVDSAGVFSEGLAAVRKGLYGYIDRTGDFVIDTDFFYAEPFCNGLAVVETDDGYRIIDTVGGVVASLDYDQVSGFSEGRAAVLSKDGWGYVDEAGELVVPCRFGLAHEFAGGLALIWEMDGSLAYIDLDGNYIWQEE